MVPVDIDRLKGLFLYNPAEPLSFTSGFFLIVFFAFLVLLRPASRNKEAKLVYLTLFSFFFYYKTSGFYFSVLAASAVWNYYAGALIHRSRSPSKRRSILAAGLIVGFAPLLYFKYAGFFLSILDDLGARPFDVSDIFLPLGISFYTFQAAGYLIDVYRKDTKPAGSLLEFTFFTSYFPRLLAGPITRAGEFLPQISGRTNAGTDPTGRAVFLIMSGLFKKMVIADYISANFVDRVFENPLQYSGVENLCAVYGYALQIYADFSGYTDLAIGISLLVGFTLPDNFRSPYRSTNITEFWRRWHMSLSFWFRDYLYIPLGGNKKGVFRQCVNIMITMLLCGLWHGGSWTFVMWGCLHGLGLVAHRLFRLYMPHRGTFPGKAISAIITFHFVCFCWIFFRADSFATALHVISQAGNIFDLGLVTAFIAGYTNVVALICAGYIAHFLPVRFKRQAASAVMVMPLPAQSVLLAFSIWIALQVRLTDIQPFIYLKF